MWPDLLAKMGQMKMRPTKQNSGHSSSVPNDVVRVLDACVAINLAATGRPLREFAPPGGTLWLCRRAANEAVYLELPGEEPGREHLDLGAAGKRAQVQVVNLRHDEYASFVEFASMVDDGEAEALAICASRHLVLATDDRKARRIALERDVPVRLTSTASMMRHWATREPRPAPLLIRAVLRSIETRARFFPANSDRDFEWWHAAKAMRQ